MNNINTHVFIDMDGVLCDFHSRACEVFGEDPKEILSKWPLGVYPLQEVLGLETEDHMWAKIDQDPEFWLNLKPYPEAEKLWQICSRTHLPVTIATSPSRNPSSSFGKVTWLRKWRGERFREYVLTPRKYLLSRPGRILIDDMDENIKKWNFYGGIGILYPRPWNANHDCKNPLLYVTNQLVRVGAL